MGRMGRDTEQDRIGQADTSQKIACGKPESGKQEAPRLWGKRTANSSEIVHTVLGSLEAYLHSNPPDYRFQVESLLERKRQILMRSDTKLPQPFASWSNSL